MAALVSLAQTGVFAGLGAFMIVVWILGILASIFWIWMLIDCLTSPMPSGEKVLWFLVIFFLHFLGALVYYFVARGGGSRHITT